MAVICLMCVSPSVSPVPPDPKSRMEGHSKLKIGKKEAHDTGDPWPHLEVEKSKVKVTEPINAMIEKQSYLRKEKAHELQTWHTDATRITDMRGDIQPQSSGSLFKSPLAGGGAYCGGSTTRSRMACSIMTNGMLHTSIHIMF